MLFFQANLWYLFRDFTIIKCKRSHLPEGMKQMILKFSKIYCLQAEDQTKILEERLVLITKSRVRHIKSLSWSHFQTICILMYSDDKISIQYQPSIDTVSIQHRVSAPKKSEPLSDLDLGWKVVHACCWLNVYV